MLVSLEHSCQHVFSGSEEFMMKFNGKPVLDKCRQMLADVGNYRFVKYRFDRSDSNPFSMSSFLAFMQLSLLTRTSTSVICLSPQFPYTVSSRARPFSSMVLMFSRF